MFGMELSELKERIQKKKSIDDIILAIIYKANPNGEKQKKSNAFFQKSFFQLKKKTDGQQLLDSFIFDNSTSPPYCEKLEEALFKLEASRKLSTLNPSYHYYAFDSGKTKLLQDSYAKFDKDEREAIDSLGRELKQIMERGR